MRSTRALAPIFLALLLAACGGSSGSSDDGGGGGPASEAAGTPQPDETTGGGGGAGLGDLDGLAADLTPPNASETSRTTVDGALFLSWNSSDSPDDLEGFYENVISQNGLDVVSRTTASGSYSWIFGSDSSSFAGFVTVAPSGQGDGSTVAVQVGTGE